MGKNKLDETYIFKISIKNSFDVTISIKILSLRDSATIEPGRSLLQFVTTNCLIQLWVVVCQFGKLLAR